MNGEMNGRSEHIYPLKTMLAAAAHPWLMTLSSCFPPWASLSSPIKWKFQIPHTAAVKIK